jgi:hypothetical protein
LADGWGLGETRFGIKTGRCGKWIGHGCGFIFDKPS